MKLLLRHLSSVAFNVKKGIGRINVCTNKIKNITPCLAKNLLVNTLSVTFHLKIEKNKSYPCNLRADFKTPFRISNQTKDHEGMNHHDRGNIWKTSCNNQRRTSHQSGKWGSWVLDSQYLYLIYQKKPPKTQWQEIETAPSEANSPANSPGIVHEI